MLAKMSLRKQIFPFGVATHTTIDTLPPLPIEDEMVQQHMQLLLEETQRNVFTHRNEEIERYNTEARRIVTIGKREICTFAPFRSQFSALQTFTPLQVFVLCLLGLTFSASILLFHIAAIVTAIAIVTVLYLSDLLLSFFLSVRTLDLSAEIEIDNRVVAALANADWPRYTILCPLYREVEVVPQFVQAMHALDYPKNKLQILFLTEEDDHETREAIQDMRLPAHFTIVTVPDGKPRTKPRACNYGLLMADGDYVVIYDAEDVPEPSQLKKAVLAFAQQGEKTACIQAKLNFYNAEQNLLTRWFTAEYSLWFDLTLPGLQKLGVPLPLGGTSNHFRTRSLRLLGAWDAFNVTEDCDLGLRQATYGFKTAVLNSTTYEEANPQVKNWIRQRSRWIKGYMQTYLVYMRKPFAYLRRGRLLEFLSLQLFVGGKTVVLFVNPFMWLLLIIYIVLHASVVDLYHTLFPLPVLYMGVLCLIFGNFFYTYSHLIGCMKRGYFHLVKWTLFIPLYWALASVASFMALQQLILKPHYWEKTQHGLHLRSAGPLPKITVIAEIDDQLENDQQPTLSLSQFPEIASRKHLERIPTRPLTNNSSALETIPTQQLLNNSSALGDIPTQPLINNSNALDGEIPTIPLLPDPTVTVRKISEDMSKLEPHLRDVHTEQVKNTMQEEKDQDMQELDNSGESAQ